MILWHRDISSVAHFDFDRKNNVNDIGDGVGVNHDDEEDEEDDDDDEDVSPIKKVRTRAYVTDAEHEVKVFCHSVLKYLHNM